METIDTATLEQQAHTPTSQPQPQPQLLSNLEFAAILFEEFEKCKATNPRYSIRAFARKININPATLSSVFKGKRKLPRKYAIDIVDRLKLRDGRRYRFLRSLKVEEIPALKIEDITDLTETDRRLLDPQTHRHIITEWEYFAIFHLLEIPEAWTAKSVASRLNISFERASEVLSGLEAVGLVTNHQGVYHMTTKVGLRTTNDIPCETLREAHQNELELAIQKLNSTPVERRCFSSRTMAIDKSQLPRAKKAIQRFSQEMGEIMTDSNLNDVYILAIQLFPVTEEA